MWEMWSGIPVKERQLPDKSLVHIGELSENEKSQILHLDGFPDECGNFRDMILKMWKPQPGERPAEVADILRRFNEERRAGRLRGPDVAERRRRIAGSNLASPKILSMVNIPKRDAVRETARTQLAKAHHTLLSSLPTIEDWRQQKTTGHFCPFMQNRVGPAIEFFNASVRGIVEQLFNECRSQLSLPFEVCLVGFDELARGLLMSVSTVNFGVLYSTKFGPTGVDHKAKSVELLERISERMARDLGNYLAPGRSRLVGTVDEIMSAPESTMSDSQLLRWSSSMYLGGSQSLHRLLRLRAYERLLEIQPVSRTKKGRSERPLAVIIRSRMADRLPLLQRLDSEPRSKHGKVGLGDLSAMAEECAMDFVLLIGCRLGHEFPSSLTSHQGPMPISLLSTMLIVALRWIRLLRQHQILLRNDVGSVSKQLPSVVDRDSEVLIANDEIAFPHDDSDFSEERNIVAAIIDATIRPLWMHTLPQLLSADHSLKLSITTFCEAEQWLDTLAALSNSDNPPRFDGRIVPAIASAIALNVPAADMSRKYFHKIEYSHRDRLIRELHRTSSSLAKTSVSQFYVPQLGEIRSGATSNVANDMHVGSFLVCSRTDLLSPAQSSIEVIIPDAPCGYRSFYPTPKDKQYLREDVLQKLRLWELDITDEKSAKDRNWTLTVDKRVYQLQLWPIWFGNELAFNYLLNLLFPGFYAPLCEVWTLVVPPSPPGAKPKAGKLMYDNGIAQFTYLTYSRLELRCLSWCGRFQPTWTALALHRS